MFRIRRPHDRIIFNMGISIPGKDGLYIKTWLWLLRITELHAALNIAIIDVTLDPVRLCSIIILESVLWARLIVWYCHSIVVVYDCHWIDSLSPGSSVASYKLQYRYSRVNTLYNINNGFSGSHGWGVGYLLWVQDVTYFLHLHVL